MSQLWCQSALWISLSFSCKIHCKINMDLAHCFCLSLTLLCGICHIPIFLIIEKSWKFYQYHTCIHLITVDFQFCLFLFCLLHPITLILRFYFFLLAVFIFVNQCTPPLPIIHHLYQKLPCYKVGFILMITAHTPNQQSLLFVVSYKSVFQMSLQ